MAPTCWVIGSISSIRALTEFRIVKRPRIGVDYAGSWARRLLRFYIRGNAHVSRP